MKKLKKRTKTLIVVSILVLINGVIFLTELLANAYHIAQGNILTPNLLYLCFIGVLALVATSGALLSLLGYSLGLIVSCIYGFLHLARFSIGDLMIGVRTGIAFPIGWTANDGSGGFSFNLLALFVLLYFWYLYESQKEA